MKKSFLFVGCVAASLGLFACGDSSSDANNVDVEENSSSSVEGESSSSEKKSEEVSSSSVAKERAATLKDFAAHKNKYLDDLFGTKVFMATGSQKGLISFWLPRSGVISNLMNVDSAWMVVQGDLKDGVLKISSDNASFSGALAARSDKGAGQKLYELQSKGGEIKFIVNEDDELQYSLNGGDFKAVVDTAVTLSSDYVTNGDKLKNKRFSCTIRRLDETGTDKLVEDTTMVYSFYDGRYIAETVVGSDTVSWVAGYSDIHKGRLILMRPEALNAKTYVDLRTGKVSKENILSFVTGDYEVCTSEDIEFVSVATKDLSATWEGSLSGETWMMTLKSDGTFSMQDVKATAGRQGTWLLYADVLMMNISACKPLEGCPIGVKGNIVDFVAKKGFTFDHPEPTSFPTKWTLPATE